jgi:hypothetical protein
VQSYSIFGKQANFSIFFSKISYHGWFLSVFSLELSDVREDACSYVLMHKNTRCLKRWERKRQTLGVIKAFTPSKCHIVSKIPQHLT